MVLATSDNEGFATMDYIVKRNAKAPDRSTAQMLPLANLQIAKVVDGELVGDALLLKGAEMAKVSTKVRNQAKRLKVTVTLRTVDDGVLVFRVKPEK